MKYTNVTEGEFVGRNNRFTAEVLIGGVQETVHVKNTGAYEGTAISRSQSNADLFR